MSDDPFPAFKVVPRVPTPQMMQDAMRIVHQLRADIPDSLSDDTIVNVVWDMMYTAAPDKATP